MGRRGTYVPKAHLHFPVAWMGLIKDTVLSRKLYKPGKHLHANMSKVDADFEAWNKPVFCYMLSEQVGGET